MDYRQRYHAWGHGRKGGFLPCWHLSKRCRSLAGAVVTGLLASCLIAPAADTGWLSAITNGPHDSWHWQENMFASDDVRAIGSENWSLQDYGGFLVAIPDGAKIDGIEVAVEWRTSNNKKSSHLGVELSSDGGMTYTLTGRNAIRTSETDGTNIFGGATDKWGRNQWAVADLTTTVFRVRLDAMDSAAQLEADWLGIRVYYTVTPPTVRNDGASEVTTGSATLNGTVTAGIPNPVARIYWGPTDGGTTPSAWSNVTDFGVQSSSFSTNVTGLAANQTNYYRCFVTNAVGGAWSGGTTNLVTAAPSVAMEGTSFAIDESGGQVVVSVRLDVTSAVPVSVNYGTAPGSAMAGADYASTNGTLTWEAYTTGSRTFAVTIPDDGVDESDEDFQVILSNAVNASIGSSATGTVVITDNDGAPTIRFATAASSGLESNTAPRILVDMVPVQGVTVTVGYAVVGGTAGGGGDDYTLAEGSVVFSPGVTQTGLTFTVRDDTLDELDETILVALSSPSSGSLGACSNHTYTILDNDVGAPGVDNVGGAIGIRAASATLRGAVTNTGGETPSVFIYWGPGNGETNPVAWSNRVSMGSMGLSAFATNVTLPVSNVTYYYRCYATNSGGQAWAAFSESFTAEDPPSASLMFNASLEDPATGADAVNWSRSDTSNLAREKKNPRTGSWAEKYLSVTGLTFSGSASNVLLCSWNGLLAGGSGVTHPAGGIRPGFVIGGTAYVRGSNPGDSTQFRYRWSNLDDASVWMDRAAEIAGNTYQALVLTNASPLAVVAVNRRFRPELVREDARAGTFYGDDLTLVASLPRLYLDRDPEVTVQYPVTGIGETNTIQLGARCAGGGSNTVLYGAYIVDPQALTSSAWNAQAWFEASDPGGAFEIVSGANLVSTNDAGGYQYATILFAPPASGTYTGKVRIATTDPTSHYTGGGTILNTIVYEEYTLVGVGLAPAIDGAPAGLDFSAYRGSLPPSQNLFVTNAGAGTLIYSNRCSYGAGAQDWLTVTPATGLLAGANAGRSHTVSVTNRGLAAGFYTATNTMDGNQGNAARDVAITLTVLGLPAPAPVTAAVNPDNPATRIDLTWTPDAANHPVMIIRSEDDSFFTPVDGTAYPVDYVSGNDRVIHNSNTVTSVTDSGRNPRATYHYRFFTQNNRYYSTGVTASASCCAPRGRNTGGGAPQQPSVVYLGDSNLVFGADAWGSLDGARGKARLVMDKDANLDGGMAGPFTEFAEVTNRTVGSPQFTSTGVWYWGMELEYETYAAGFWYCSNGVGYEELAAAPAASTLSVNVQPLDPATSASAAPGGADPKHTVQVDWIGDGIHPALLVRRDGALPPDAPAQGTHFNPGDACGDGVVVYKGSAGSFLDSGLTPGTRYTYGIHTENDGYYSSGVETGAATNPDERPSGTRFTFR